MSDSNGSSKSKLSRKDKKLLRKKADLEKQLFKVTEKLSDSRSRSGSVASKSSLTKRKPLSSSDSESDSGSKRENTRRSRSSTQILSSNKDDSSDSHNNGTADSMYYLTQKTPPVRKRRKRRKEFKSAPIVNNSFSEDVHTSTSLSSDPSPEAALFSFKSLCATDTSTESLLNTIKNWSKRYDGVFNSTLDDNKTLSLRETFLNDQLTHFKGNGYKIGSTEFELCHILHNNPSSGLRLCSVIAHSINSEKSFSATKSLINKLIFTQSSGIHIPSPDRTSTTITSNETSGFQSPITRKTLTTIT